MPTACWPLGWHSTTSQLKLPPSPASLPYHGGNLLAVLLLTPAQVLSGLPIYAVLSPSGSASRGSRTSSPSVAKLQLSRSHRIQGIFSKLSRRTTAFSCKSSRTNGSERLGTSDCCMLNRPQAPTRATGASFWDDNRGGGSGSSGGGAGGMGHYEDTPAGFGGFGIDRNVC